MYYKTTKKMSDDITNSESAERNRHKINIFALKEVAHAHIITCHRAAYVTDI